MKIDQLSIKHPITDFKHLVNYSEDIDVLQLNKEIFEDQDYRMVFEGHSPKKNLVIVDLGANIGMFSVYAYPYAKKIYAIEPFEENYDLLLENIKDLDRVTAHKVAISNKKGIAIMHATPKNLIGAKIVYDPHEDEPTQKVNTITLAQFLENIPHVDILKVDIEGEEENVFFAADFKEASKKIDRIIGEHYADRVMPILRNCGFSTAKTDKDYFYAWRNK